VTSEGWSDRFGRPETYSLAAEHTFIEGKVGRFSMLRRLPALNFIIGQFDILICLTRLIRKEKISVIRAGDCLYNGLLGWMLSRLSGVPLVVRVGANHDKIRETTGRPIMPRFFGLRRIEKMVERFVLSHADLVAGANQDNLDFAITNGARPESSTLFRYGNLIDKMHFTKPEDRVDGRALLNELGVMQHRFLLYIGRLESVKHPEDVLRVLAEIRKRGHDMKAILAGDGRLLGLLTELARELGVEDQVVFCGNRDQEWLAQITPLAAVVVSPHTGRALSEAALGAVPIVAYDVDWQGELIETGITGELVPHLDWEKMADAAERFLTDQVYARSMGNNVRKRALEMMDPAMLNQHERNQYTALLLRPERY
jgi:glycosyltransferase involved in cell wall biosynthesis